MPCEIPDCRANGCRRVRFLCAHGAGAGMDTPFMDTVAGLLAERGIATYASSSPIWRRGGKAARGKPPPKAERLMDEYRAAVAGVPEGAPC